MLFYSQAPSSLLILAALTQLPTTPHVVDYSQLKGLGRQHFREQVCLVETFLAASVEVISFA